MTQVALQDYAGNISRFRSQQKMEMSRRVTVPPLFRHKILLVVASLKTGLKTSSVLRVGNLGAVLKSSLSQEFSAFGGRVRLW